MSWLCALPAPIVAALIAAPILGGVWLFMWAADAALTRAAALLARRP